MTWITLGATVAFMLPWQLSSFIMLTQCLAIIAIEVLSAISSRRLSTYDSFVPVYRSVIRIHIAAFFVVALLQFGNRMVIESPAFCLAISCEVAYMIIDMAKAVSSSKPSIENEGPDSQNENVSVLSEKTFGEIRHHLILLCFVQQQQ